MNTLSRITYQCGGHRLPSIRNGDTPLWRYEKTIQSCGMTAERVVRQLNNVGSNTSYVAFDPAISSGYCTNR